MKCPRTFTIKIVRIQLKYEGFKKSKTQTLHRLFLKENFYEGSDPAGKANN